MVLLPPSNSRNGDTDVEEGDDDSLTTTTLANVNEVSGTLVVQSSRDTSRVTKQKIYKDLPPNYEAIVALEKSKIQKAMDSKTLAHDTKINEIAESSLLLDNLRKWEKGNESYDNSGLKWKTEMGLENAENFENLNALCGGKMPVEVFDLLFNDTIASHIVLETNRYAQQSNRCDFSLSSNDLKTFVGVLIYSGYHSLPQQRLYWERNRDVETPMVFES